MELAILAALGLLGYELRGKRTPAGASPNNNPHLYQTNNQFPFEPNTWLSEVSADEAERVRYNLWLASQTPGQKPPDVSSIPFHNNMTPFFSSSGTQNTNDAVKLRRLETFTGTDNDAYAKKEETRSLFNPSETKTTTSGMPSMTDTERFSTFTSSTFHTNVNADPSSNQLVGPGVGLTYDDAPQGGFHPESVLRVLPNNVNSYRINQLDAFGANPGRGVVEGRTGEVENFRGNELDTFWSQSQHPTMPTGGVVKAHASGGGEFVLKDKRGEVGICHPGGNPSLGGVGGRGPHGDVFSRREAQCHKNPGAPSLSSAGARVSDSEWIVPQQSREQQNFACHGESNIRGPPGAKVNTGYYAGTTLRETTHSSHDPAPSFSNNAAGGPRDSALLRGTLRETMAHTQGGENIQAVFPGAYVPIGQQNTLAGQQLDQSEFITAPSCQGQGTFTGPGETHINGKVLVEDHCPHAQSANQPLDPSEQPVWSCSIDDDSCFRPPVLGKALFQDRGFLGQTEIK